MITDRSNCCFIKLLRQIATLWWFKRNPSVSEIIAADIDKRAHTRKKINDVSIVISNPITMNNPHRGIYRYGYSFMTRQFDRKVNILLVALTTYIDICKQLIQLSSPYGAFIRICRLYDQRGIQKEFHHERNRLLNFNFLLPKNVNAHFICK